MKEKEVETTMELLGIQEVTSKRQKKNGTRIFKLPIKDVKVNQSILNYLMVIIEDFQLELVN